MIQNNVHLSTSLPFLNTRTVKAARKNRCKIVTYEWLTDTFQLLDYHNKKKAPTSLYHPGKPRDGDAISNLFKISETKAKSGKKKGSPAAADATAVKHDDDAQAAEEAAETGMKHLTISEEGTSQKSAEEKDSRKPSDSGEEKGTKVIDDTKEASTPVKKESGKPAGKPKKKAKVKDQEPPVDLDLYDICKSEAGLLQIELWKPDEHGNERGSLRVLELWESKSEPKTYLFGFKKYPTADPSTCIRRFPSKVPGDKKHELWEFTSSFWDHTGVHWHHRDSRPSKGPYYYLSSAAPGKTAASSGHKNESSEHGREKEQNQTSSVAVPREQRDGDRETSSKRKSGFSEERPAKAFKVTKPLVADGPAKTTNDVSKAA